MPTAFVVVLVLVLASGIGGGIWLEPRLHAVLVRGARGSAWRGALVSAAVQLAALIPFGVVALVAGRLEGAPRAVLTTVAALAYAPVIMCAMPSKYSGYREQRSDLRRAGARRPVDRGIAWAGGPVALAGLAILCAALIATFAP